MNNCIKHPNMINTRSRQVEIVTGQESIHQSIGLLLRSCKYELMGDPNYGTNIVELTYSQNDQYLRDLVAKSIYSNIKTYLPMITVTFSDITFTSDMATLTVNVKYRINDSNLTSYYRLEILGELE